ncbi:MAG: MlaD family protein [Candidatus Acidiferrales bacterium]
MRAQRTVTWAELRVGLMVLASLAVISAFVFAAGQGREFFVSKNRYVTYLPDVAGLQAGAPVRLVGFTVGAVEEVGLSEMRDDPKRHAAVRFQIYTRYAPDIRTDSEAFVTTEGLLGQSVLELTRGVKGEPIADGGVVAGVQRGSMKQVVQNMENLTGEMHALVADIRKDPKKYLNMKISLF